MNDMLVLTVAVRNTDGAVYHYDKWQAGKYTSLKHLPVFTGNPANDNRWWLLIKQLKSHRKPCKVRLIVGWNDDKTPIVEELTYRPKTVIQPVVTKATRPIPQRLE